MKNLINDLKQSGKIVLYTNLINTRVTELNDMTIGITVIDKDSPISIDTYEDLEKARDYAKQKM